MTVKAMDDFDVIRAHMDPDVFQPPLGKKPPGVPVPSQPDIDYIRDWVQRRHYYGTNTQTPVTKWCEALLNFVKSNP